MARKAKDERAYQEMVLEKLREILENKPCGANFSDIVDEIQESFKEIARNSINVYVMQAIKYNDIAKPTRGFYILRKFLKEDEVENLNEVISPSWENYTTLEHEFYKSLSDYLVNDIEECIKAIPLGGNRFKDKWGTPDVIGFYTLIGRFKPFDVKEVVGAELKTDVNQLIIAFGQACSYKLFCHKVYLVIPRNSNAEELVRVEMLCLKFGIGLILFDNLDKDNPNYTLRARAIKNEPDYFYLNKYLNLLHDYELGELGI